MENVTLTINIGNVKVVEKCQFDKKKKKNRLASIFRPYRRSIKYISTVLET